VQALSNNLPAEGKRIVAISYPTPTLDAAIPTGSRDSADPGPYARGGFQPRWLSPEMLAVIAAAIDFSLIPFAAAMAAASYSVVTHGTVVEPDRWFRASLLAATLFVFGFERMGGYKLKQLSRLDWQLTRTFTMWGVTVSSLLLIAFLIKTSEAYSRAWTLAWITAVPVLLLSARWGLHLAIVTWTRTGCLGRNVAVVGAGKEGERLIAKLQGSHDKSIAIRGIFDDRKSRLPPSVCGMTVLGTTDDLQRFARLVPLDEVIIALPLDAERRLRALCDKIKALAIDVRVSIEPLAETFQVRGASYVGGVPVLEIADRPLKNWRAIAKWIEDKVLASLLLVFVGPLMVAIAILIKLDSRGPVLFVQNRFGFNNEVIRVLKFRTMHVDRGDPSGAQRTVRNDPRVTRVGRFLRWLSLDELPQLINVLRGDMSLVGPRPHAIAMKAGDRLYCDAVEQYLHRHRVKPGITGWAQVHGLRGEVSTLARAHARVAHDLYYIDHLSIWLDLKILAKTLVILVSRDNAY
jgi:Undecaprenyl-phosphate glucose phosphotransferase